MTIVWNKNFETGNHVVDFQHRQLFKAFLAMMEICASGRKDRNEATLCFLVDFTNKHIHDSIAARVLSQSQSPVQYIDGFQHERLLNFVSELEHKVKTEGPSSAISEEIKCFVYEVLGNLVNHIRMEKEIATGLGGVTEGITADDSTINLRHSVKPLRRIQMPVGFH